MPSTAPSELKNRLNSARLEVYRPVILDAAEALFAEQGVAKARIKDIAKRAGVSVGSVYGVFDGKDALYAAVHARRTATLLEGAERIAADLAELAELADPADQDPQRGGDALAVILAGVDHTVRFFCAHPDYLRMHLREGTTWAQSATGTEVQAETWQSGADVIAAAFEHGMEAGTLHPGDPRLNARMVMAMLQVALAEWLPDGPDGPDAPECAETAARRVDELVDNVQVLVRRAFAR